MADDNTFSSPSPDLPPAHAVTTGPGVSAPAAQHVTTAPSLGREDAAGPPADVVGGLLRGAVSGLLGAVVGFSVGLLVVVVCQRLFGWSKTPSTFILLVGGGLVLGVFFSGFLVRALGLMPRLRSPSADDADGRSDLRIGAARLLGLCLILACGWGLIAFAYYLAATLYHGAEGAAVIAVLLAAAASLVLFLLLERRHWLSRLMSLPVAPDRPAWNSSVLLWLFGVYYPLVRFRLAARDTAPQISKSSARAAPADAPPADGFREIVETVVFVVVLVLLLKSFAAEAFVIPTGSMAETLLGYQKMVVCPQCGFEFPVNCSQQIDPQSGPPDWIRGGTCPNCREHVRFVQPSDKPGPDSVDDPPALTGDRVLVAKFLYDLFEKPPDRLDVVVFKYPGDKSFPQTGPFRDGVPMNYIKRLIGLPGETIAIHNGNLYVLAGPDQRRIDDLRKKLHEELNRDPTPDEMQEQMLKRYGQLAYFDLERETDPAKRVEWAKQLWQKDHMHVNDPQALDLFLQKDSPFQIIRKPPDTILSMRRIVYDNDHPAKDLVSVQPPRWADRDKTASWTVDAAKHSFQLPAPADDQVHWLGYHNLLRDQGDRPQLITDFLGYNTWEGQHLGHPSPGENWVGDLSLDCEVDVPQSQGELTLELSKGVDRFQARFNLADGECKLVRIHADGTEEELDHKPTALKAGTHSVRFANVDERMTVWVDDALPFGDGVTYKPPSKEGATKENDLDRPAGIGVKGTTATVRGVKLYRDSYYTTQNSGYPDRSDAPGVNLSDPATWGELARLPVKTLYVQPDPKHYLCLGDNSPESSDGRSWGLVPERLLLGKAIAVYYPFNRFGRIR